MSVRLPIELELFRAQIRLFANETVPASLREKSQRHQVLDKADYVAWMKLLNQQGWAIGHWPQQFGGQNWSLMQRFVFEDELARLGLPWVIPFGVKYVGPVIYTYGSPEQQKRYLPAIASADEFWAQGYSEPGAGSDLAALRTEAIREGDDYIVNGQKIWTTYAQWADWLFCLVRTANTSRQQDGITFLLIEMNTPGITVKPIRTMDGYHHVNEVWFDNVRVPVANRVGEEGAGWSYAKFLLKNERTAGAIVGMAWHVLHRLKQLAANLAEPSLNRRIAEFELRFIALETSAYRAVQRMMEGTEDGGEASVIKILGTELYQEVAETTVEALGSAGVAYDINALHNAAPPPLGPDDSGGILKDHFYNRAATIFGGSSEVQRNIIAKVVLGL
ncbi:MAG TPA: acyl-CoA dehydrogenase family protein [Pseudomonadales bacterium]|nr:acyl-CoA dehydrogenase family protein [Pseudomonadales bacterium]